MIRRYCAPLSPSFSERLSALQARAYAPTGMRGWSAAEIAELVDMPVSRLLVAQDHEGQPTGFLLASVVDIEAEILAIAVDPSLQRRGIASKLVFSLERSDVREPNGRIILEVAENNENAIFLYETLMFRTIGIRSNYYLLNGIRIDARIMERHCSFQLI